MAFHREKGYDFLLTRRAGRVLGREQVGTSSILKRYKVGIGLNRIILPLLLIALTLAAACPGQAGEDLGSLRKNSLWRIRAEKNTLYLQGSVHLLKGDNYPLAPLIEKAFEQSQVLVLEADLREMQDPKVQQGMLARGTLPAGQRLQDQLSKKTYALCVKALQELNMDISVFGNLKPWMLAVSLVMAKLHDLGFNPQYGVDQYFMTRAIRSGKQIMGLETVEEQILLLDTLSREEQDVLVLQTLRDLDIIEEKVDAMVAAWSTGDVQTMEAIMLESFKDYPAVYDNLIAKRNGRWVARIEKLLNQPQNYMVVVGVLHLIGEDGLVALLRGKGYIVEQM